MKATISARSVALLIAILFVGVPALRLGWAALRVARAPEPTQGLPSADLGSTTSLRILPLYEEATADAGYLSGHGVSYLIRTDEATVLMDLGHNPAGSAVAPVAENAARAGLAPGEIDLLVLSHHHPDHMGGLRWRPETFAFAEGASLLAATAHAPEALELPGGPAEVAEEPAVLAPGVATLGRMSYVQAPPFSLWAPLGHEQVLALNVAGRGVVLITGCGHPTLERIVARAEALLEEPVVGVVGGLHYEGATAETVAGHVAFLAARDPQLVALSPHDSAPEAIAAFREAFPAAYREIRVGEAITFGGGQASAE
jgi:7,8-dihydropterin-6-yl-methyl-4-(beta-D-ribofuranosyl)aminobenzene 5'-phosphate synthase